MQKESREFEEDEKDYEPEPHVHIVSNKKNQENSSSYVEARSKVKQINTNQKQSLKAFLKWSPLKLLIHKSLHQKDQIPPRERTIIKSTAPSRPPEDFVYPITGQIFNDPVTLETG
ncbi:hypothetical protein H5410_032120 [Solanum commersonii]|uniref:U-box domain-containing protein n=1 Tax=Solanum commersonii TaxID=4109 RepID=A0A9J5YPE5_SOLCO|nr:hypothetical protein H5410_032120 [Solanum commersonii]